MCKSFRKLFKRRKRQEGSELQSVTTQEDRRPKVATVRGNFNSGDLPKVATVSENFDGDHFGQNNECFDRSSVGSSSNIEAGESSHNDGEIWEVMDVSDATSDGNNQQTRNDSIVEVSGSDNRSGAHQTYNEQNSSDGGQSSRQQPLS